MSAVDEPEIVDRLRNDDQSALTVVLRKIVPGLWPLLAKKFQGSLSHEDIDEVVATSLAKLWQNRRRFDSTKGDFKGWLFVIMRNTALDVLRRRTPKAEEYLIVEPLPESRSATDENSQQVMKQTVASLSDRERRVLLPLFDRSDVSVADLSRDLSVSSGAIRQLRFRALRKLNRRLAKFGLTTRRVRTAPQPHPVQQENSHVDDGGSEPVH